MVGMDTGAWPMPQCLALQEKITAIAHYHATKKVSLSIQVNVCSTPNGCNRFKGLLMLDITLIYFKIPLD